MDISLNSDSWFLDILDFTIDGKSVSNSNNKMGIIDTGSSYLYIDASYYNLKTF